MNFEPLLNEEWVTAPNHQKFKAVFHALMMRYPDHEYSPHARDVHDAAWARVWKTFNDKRGFTVETPLAETTLTDKDRQRLAEVKARDVDRYGAVDVPHTTGDLVFRLTSDGYKYARVSYPNRDRLQRHRYATTGIHRSLLREIAETHNPALAKRIAEIERATTPNAAPASASYTPVEIDFGSLTTRAQLIAAFGPFTGMDMSWFKNVKDSPALMAARKVAGRGGRGHITEPLFCPFEVMQWLAGSKRRKGRALGAEKAWELLEKNFSKVYSAQSVADPRTGD